MARNSLARHDVRVRDEPSTARAPLALGAATAGATALVIVGWVAEVQPLRGPLPGAAEMKLNTAVAIVLLALAVIGWARGRPPAARACAATAGLIGGLTLAEHLLGADLGIDELLRADDGRLPGSNPGRMAPITALVTTLLSAALLLGPAGRRAAFQILAVAGWLLTTFALFGYVFGAITPRGGTTTPIAPHTALLLNLSAVAMLTLQRDFGLSALLRGAGAGSIVARRVVLPALVVLPVVGWVRLQGEYEGLFGVRDGVALYTLAFFCILAGSTLFAARSLNAWQLRAERGERRLQAVLDAATEQSIVATDPDGTITVFSAGAERMLGWRAEELVGRATPAVIHDPAEVAARAAELGVAPGFDAFVAEVLRTGTPETRQWTYLRRDGSRLPVLLTVTAAHDAEGGVQGFLGVAVDRTEALAAEAALRDAVAEAERANRAKSEFLSRMSHELRTPLNAVLGFGQVLELESLTADQRRAVGHILGGGRHLLGLIDEILDIARIEAGVLPISVEAVELGPVIDECLQLVGPLASENGVALARDMPTGTFVRADPQRLRQVLLNLLSNAVKYNRDGGAVHVVVIHGDPVEIRVDDTGPGLPAGAGERLFAPFDRLGAEASNVEGTGLGLTVSQAVAERMGGSLRAEDSPEGGARFILTLDAASDPEPEVAAAPVIGHVALDPRVRRVLYVEDNQVNRAVVERVFAAVPGVELRCAADGRTGLDVARLQRPDVVLLDLHLPDANGLEVLRALRAETNSRHIGVVVLTADVATRGRDALRAAGVAAFVAKPFEVPALLLAVNRAARRSERARAQAERTAEAPTERRPPAR